MFSTITDEEIKGKGVQGLPDTPGLSTAEMQAKFDELSRDVIIPKINELVGSLNETGIYEKQIVETVNDSDSEIPTSAAVVKSFAELGGGDMMRATYDKSKSGIVDDSEKLGGKSPEFYASKTDVENEAAERQRQIDEVASGQIPDEYLQARVDEYLANNDGGLATKEDIGNLSSEIVDLEEVVKDKIGSILSYNDGYITTGVGVGTVVNVDNITESDGYKHTVVDCKAGDKFSIVGYGGMSPRLYAFLDNANILLTVSEPQVLKENPYTIVAPTNATKLVVNFATNHNSSLIYENAEFRNITVEAENVNISNTVIKTISDYEDSSGIVSFNNGIITQTHSGSGNNWWRLSFNPTDITSNFVRLETIVDSIVGEALIYLQYYKTDGSTNYVALKPITESGKYTIDIDLNYFSVYGDANLNRNCAILFANQSADLTIVYSKADVCDRITQLDTDKNLLEYLDEMSADITSAKAIAQSAGSNIKLVGSDGKKYFLQVSNGQLTVSPAIPSNILYIGNSLLLGFGFGMAASNSKEDYFAYVNDYVKSQGVDVVTNKISGTTFEGCTTIDAQNQWFNGTLINSLDNDLDMVIIQLGDNVNTAERLAVFENGAKNLVKFIREHAPNARVAWVGEWYSNATKQMYIANACANYGATFVDISDLPKISGNKAKIGDVITFDDGTTSTINDSGVATHPSSQGMKAIADRMIETLF